ncbi:hypothetical protein DIURU_004854 [Diutina rugosa]|uniref:Uncharacterized protein n=1 Tax=Diutina rugosa TaxID=5481 RepID=A0A642UFF0_DIURU|nr:uncharacterized protein DIURU_004854 [Diutina rugosa]KAA8898001.1 hypothetical protein DIURU_004854 [Diutina rugosa]
MVTMVSTSEALVALSNSILNSIGDLNKLEYNKKGRKYRFVNNNFQRIREEDKHLVICPEEPESQLAVMSSFYILLNTDNGELLRRYPDFCLAIIGCAREIEAHGWYEEENSSVVHVKNAKYDPRVVSEPALEYIRLNPIEQRHIDMGLVLMTCAKLNFLHTDHHIGTKVEGFYMKHFIKEYFGEELLASPEVLVALKSFVHWGNIKGILYRLDVPNIKTTPELVKAFSQFPEPMEELKLSVYDRYPSGTSKYSLIRKSIDVLGDWQFSSLIPYPQDFNFDLDWLYELCHNIEKDPVKYHLRSSTKALCENPVNLGELSSRYSKQIAALLDFISMIIHTFEDTGGDFLLQNSKIPKLTPELISRHSELYQQIQKLYDNVRSYEEKGWDTDDIVLRLGAPEKSLFSTVMAMREKYSDDYE